MKRLGAFALLFALLAAAPAHQTPQSANGTIDFPKLPLLPGSIVPIGVMGIATPYDIAVLGPGKVVGAQYVAPDAHLAGTATLLASGKNGAAMRAIAFASPPPIDRSFLVVASYEDGITFHEAKPPYAPFATLGIGGAPGDVAISNDGELASGATNGLTATIARIDPWKTRSISGVPFTDEIAIDRDDTVFASNRDLGGGGKGALTRIRPDGTTMQLALGTTAEGLVLDPIHRRAYVANVNDGTVSVVDADTMLELTRFTAVSRAFGVALSPDGSRLYVTSNQSESSPFAAPGGVVAFETSGAPRLIARSGRLAFPIGVAVRADARAIFVTDEHDDTIHVLDAATLRPLRMPLRTCKTPWKPLVDGTTLWIPCARANEIDAFDTMTYARLRGAPFHTGGYPLAVAVWHGSRALHASLRSSSAYACAERAVSGRPHANQLGANDRSRCGVR